MEVTPQRVRRTIRDFARDTALVKHRADDRGRRVWRALLDGFDKGAGANRRTRAAELDRGVFAASMLLDGRWVKGRAGIDGSQLTFVAADGRATSVSLAGAEARPAGRRRLVRDRRLGLWRTTRVDVEAIDGRTLSLAADSRVLLAIFAAIQ